MDATVKAFYNEIDPYCCAWLSNLMDAGLITPGKIDDRSIEDLRPNDLAGYKRVHMFAGIGVWDYALNQAGWKGEVWTGSCPCQPFSGAGKQLGQEDERHLAPAWLDLIGECKPTVVFGEQVEAAIKKSWLDALQTHLEAESYAVGAIVLPACGIGSPNIRQRLWFVAERLGNTIDQGLEGHTGNEDDQAGRQEPDRPTAETGSSSGMADSDSPGPQPGRETTSPPGHGNPADQESSSGRHEPAGPTNGFWRDADWLFCRDGKWRPVESRNEQMDAGFANRMGYSRIGDRYSLNPLIKKAENRVVRLRGYGNAINAEVAKEFISTFMDIQK